MKGNDGLARSTDENLMALQFEFMVTYHTNRFLVDRNGLHRPYGSKKDSCRYVYLHNGKVVAESNELSCRDPDDIERFAVLTSDVEILNLLIEEDGRLNFKDIDVDLDAIDWKRYNVNLQDLRLGTVKRVPYEIPCDCMEFVIENFDGDVEEVKRRLESEHRREVKIRIDDRKLIVKTNPAL